MVYGLIVAVRRWMYRAGLRSSVRLPVPVLVVGNLTVGGSGKTPLVLWIVHLLRGTGMSPGIVLRGYGSKASGSRCVVSGSAPARVGDEAVLLSQRSGCPVWVGIDRVAAARALLDANPRCDVLVCDDGLQHYRLARDFEIAVEDERGHGNGWLLPAGPLREPAGRRVDVTIVNAAENVPLPVRYGVILRMQLVPARLYRIGSNGAADEVISPDSLRGRRLHAIAGIGSPQRFFATLRALGLDASSHAFPDHHPFSAADLEFPDCDAVLMTEKDAVKCRSLDRRDMIALSVDAVPDSALEKLVLKAAAAGSTVSAKFP